MGSDTLGPAARRHSGSAVLGLLAVALGVLLLSVPVASVLLGAVGIAGGLRSRAQLKADPALRGTFPSVVAFLGGVLLVGIKTVPLVLSLVLAALP